MPTPIVITKLEIIRSIRMPAIKQRSKPHGTKKGKKEIYFTSKLKSLYKHGLLPGVPDYAVNMSVYEAMMGSHAYGTASGDSDIDLYSVCIPPKRILFPFSDTGNIYGFGKDPEKFHVYQQHHINYLDDLGGRGREYDMCVYNIVSYLNLAMKSNPNIIDSLFVPDHCVLHITPPGQIFRENRKLFLCKGSYFKLKSYAYSQMHKMEIKSPEAGSKRKELVDKYGYDVKFASHCVRLVYQCQQILESHDLNLQLNKEEIKAIKRGEKTASEIKSFFSEKEKYLESLYQSSTLRDYPDEELLKKVLLNCLEAHYGSLGKVYKDPDESIKGIRDINQICQKILKNYQ